MQFRPCIDLRNGQVVQIVGSSLSDSDDAAVTTNFQTDRKPAEFAKLYESEVVLVHATPIYPDAPSMADVQGVPVDQACTEHIYAQRDRLKAAGIDVDVKILPGTAAEEIFKLTNDEAYDLIAMTTHGRTGVSRWMFGSG